MLRRRLATWLPLMLLLLSRCRESVHVIALGAAVYAAWWLLLLLFAVWQPAAAAL
jgi:hypothetical protein